ncbi:uncharacterized protein V1510DRAFT_421265 [Dipodascopsis tothii]|uniref:uncharacterized protein n=1 Tax=Dipodascopsis tothii TaxID=44089 RepID=UPI0034CE6E8C
MVAQYFIKEPYLTPSCLLSETPVYQPATKTLYFIDMPRHQVLAASVVDSAVSKVGSATSEDWVEAFATADDAVIKKWTFNHMITYVGRTPEPDVLVLAAKEGVAVVDFKTLEPNTATVYDVPYKVHVFADRPTLRDSLRFNDANVDTHGRLWAGTMPLDWLSNMAQRIGQLWRFDGPEMTPTLVLEHLGVPNGMCWSPDNKYFYLADSAEHTVYRFDYDAETAAITNRMRFINTDAPIRPDGFTISESGHIFLTLTNGGSRVLEYTPHGGLVAEYHLPARKVSCCVFGGDANDELFVTTAHDPDAPADDQGGQIFRFRVKATALPYNALKA